MADVWERDAARPRGRVGRGDPVGHPRPSRAPAAARLTQAYEERFLFLLLLLRQPRLRMVYVTSMPIAPAIVEYYLGPARPASSRATRARGCRWSPSATPRRAAEREAARAPAAPRADRGPHPEPARSHLIPYNTTELERDVALTLGIPMYGADPRLVPLGTKTGCRRLFAEAACRTRSAPRTCTRLDEVADARRRHARRAADDGQVDRQAQRGRVGRGQRAGRPAGLPARGYDRRAGRVLERVREMELEVADAPFEAYLAKLAERGGIVEERIAGVELRSPSVQLRVTPGRRAWSCCRPTTSCSAGRAGRATSAARSPPTRRTPAISEEARDDRRAAGARGRARPVRRRLRRGARTTHGAWRRTRSS